MSFATPYLQTEFYHLLCTDRDIQDFFRNENIDGIWFYDPQHQKQLWATVPFLHCLGYTPSDFNGQLINWESIIAPQDQQVFGEMLYQVCGQTVDQNEISNFRFLHKNGSLIDIFCKARSVNGNTRLLGIIKKIKTESLCKPINAIPVDAIIQLISNFFILDGAYRFVNFLYKPDEASLAISVKDILGKSFKEIGFPDLVCSAIAGALNEVTVTRQKQQVDFMLTINNTEQWFRMVATVWDPSRKDSHLICVMNNITQHQKDEFNKSKYFSALENSIDGVSFLSTEGFCTYVNANYAKMLGRDPDELVGKHWRMYLSENEVRNFDREIIPTLYATGSYVGTIQGLRKTGQLFPVSISLTVTPDLGIICILRDMSDMEAMQEKLNEKNRLLVQFSKEVPTATYMVEQTSSGEIGFSFESDDFRKKFPWLLNEQKHFDLALLIKYMHPEDLEVLAEKTEGSKLNQSLITLDARIKNENNAYHWYNIRAQPIHQADDSYKWFGTVEDITERKIAEAYLEPFRDKIFTYESKYESLLTASNLGGWEYDATNNELWCSREYFAMMGREKDYPARWACYQIREVWEDFIHPDDLLRAKKYFSAFLDNLEGTYSQEFRMKHANGSWLWVSSRGRALRNEQTGKPTGLIIGTHIDITETRELSDYLIESRKKLLTDNALLKAIIDSQQNIYILALDLQYRFIAFTKSYAAYSKKYMRREAAVGISIFDVLPVSLHEFARTNYNRAMKGEQFTSTYTDYDLDGRPIHYLNRYSPIIDEKGAVHGITLFLSDITETRLPFFNENR
ncbi:MAG: PAS domain-containing protein [Sediminibacterium sp.]|nr:PAS domain-containing protein [Sediminibacterium sp.]